MNRDELAKYLLEKFQDKIEPLQTGKAEPFFLLKKPEDLVDFCRAVRDDTTLRMDYLCMMCGVDTGEHFEVVYSLASIKNRLRFDFKFPLPFENAEIDSVQEVWAGANWFEREVWELYGINVRNHGNLTRFLLPDDWNQGHPMRKNWDAPDFKRMPEV
ncbi:MAG: hypothetical protein CVT49_13130 [candidate division Zixibacteria bacterium HGW-Zixibacteria-1]|nr:MAG: hypothetical protein CVT49_13130 [candidate division Zixibacteria bacterium HGW-Zixibacteria-1]